MMVSNRGSVLRLMMWQWRNVLLFTLAAAVVVVLHKFFGIAHVMLPTTPVTIIGAAMAIFVSFRTNSAYDRWWEGRRLWGQLVNSSRMFATQVLTYLNAQGDDGRRTARLLIERHALYVHVLRCLLREQRPADDEDVKRLASEREIAEFTSHLSPTHAILHEQQRMLVDLADRGLLEERRLQSIDRTIASFLDVQGGCERIKKTPMPRGYGFVADRLIKAFGILFPLSMADELGWAMIPINLLVGLSFALISESGRVLEDPFTMFWNGLPLSAISRTIEVNVRQPLGETDLPAVPAVSPLGILM